MTDGGHVPNEGLPEHLLAGPDPLGGPEGVSTVAPGHGVAPDGGLIPNPAAPGNGLPGAVGQGIGMFPAQGPGGQPQPLGVPGYGVQAPGEGWGVDQGAPRPAFHFLDQPDQPDPLDDEDDVLLMPGPQGSWGEPLAAAPGEQSAEQQAAPGEQSAEQQAAPGTPVEPSWPPLEPPVLGAADPAAQQVQPQPVPLQAAVPQQVQPPLQAQGQDQLTAAQQPRRPLHAGPPIPDPSLMTGQVPVRSLADRGPSQGGTPAHGIPVFAGQPEPQATAPAQAQPAQQPMAPVQPPQAVPPAQEAPQAPQYAEPAAQPVGAVEVAAPVADAGLIAEAPVAAPAADAVVEPAAVVEQVPVQVPVAEQTEALPAEAVAAEPVAVEQVTAVEPAVAEPVAVEAQAPDAAQAAPQQPAAQAGQPRRISAFLAAPTPHGLPQVEGTEPVQAVAEGEGRHAVPIAVAEQTQAPAAEPVPDTAPEQPAVELVAVEPVAVEQPAVEQPAAEPVPAAQEPDAVEQAPVVTDGQAPAEGGSPAEAAAGTGVEAAAEESAETAVGTGEMPSGQAVAVAVAEPEQSQEAPAEAAAAAPGPEEVVVEPAAVAEPVEPEAAPEAAAEVPEAAEAPEVPEAPAEQSAAETEPEAAGADAAAPDAEAGSAEAAEPAEAADPAEAAEPVTEEPVTEEPVTEEPAEEPAEPRGPAAPGYDDVGREAVHQVIRERRDIRNGFRPDQIPHEVLIRVLEAAHTAPSVGYSQPWDFVVIRSAKTRRKMHELAERQREAYADSLPKGRAKQFKEIKIEAILETPVNIVVTADRTRGGRHTLGRHTQPQMAPYSAALAVENLWLAARAEGLGVGWVSFFDEEEMVRELGLPEHLEVVAYLCVGYVDAFPDEPELQQQGWAKKRPLSWVVHEEQYGNRALPGEEPHSLLSETLRGIRPLDAKALGEAWDRQKRMTKPAGSLGMLEIISAQLSGLSRKCPPPIPEPACVAIFAGDHGVHAQGVSPWPQEVTAQMVGNFLAGGAVINAFAKQIGTEVCVVDVGVAAELPDAIQQGRTTGLLPRKVRPGTGDMTQGPAMTRDEVLKAVEIGIETARDLVAAGNKALVTGDMGIANTTASAALISVFTGLDPAEVTGRGTGIDDATHARKVEVVRAALALHQPDPADPIGVLAAVGGLEHAAIAGFLLGAASLRTPVILDGVIAGSAALAAKAIAPEVLAACIAGHRSAEPGHQAALAKLGLRPLIDLDLRLGEGTGALLALPLVQSAARAMHDVATFDSAGVTEKA
ncbi:nicotinate-nucleotide--dimethylbenzimidazole phosphoribosyltransferase [Kitasatospora sp. NBC_01246]|uniref:nicotinate-nucleotide--dimethylbenzimidazole phosphoribosyltransferase n=1 Tax=Kitasatospora sp. NBC_01246 TaxID=2903570 RepID=UPI002E363D2E|nr:nicotinate-nucleotide--dimethylbenzimidazole phosphoribosyltransferase [Kitasatospora sp. NBC_01246]